MSEDGGRHRGPAARLPKSHHRLIGREQEIREIERLLVERIPVLSIVATGGAGKTRLAAAVAEASSEHFDGQVFFVDLAGVSDPDGVPAAIAGVLQVQAGADRSVEQAVFDELQTRSALLVLDNFEQILPAGRFVANLADRCPLLSILVTSRSPLRIAGERVFVLRPLAFDRPDADAIALFTERARLGHPAFELSTTDVPIVMELCARLDGLPLAIELAASRVKVLAPAALVERFDRPDAAGLRLLSLGSRDAPDRHQTLERTIAWSYELLSEHARLLLRTLAVFEAGATLRALEAIADADAIDDLNELVDLHLVSVEEGEERRYRLFETVREFGSIRLAEPENAAAHEALRERFRRYYAQLASDAQEQLESPDDGRTLALLDADYANLRTALDELEARGEIAAALTMTTSLASFWRLSGRREDARARLLTLWERCDPATLAPRQRAEAHITLGRLSAESGRVGIGSEDAEHTMRHLDEGLALHRQHGSTTDVIRALESMISALVQHEDSPLPKALCQEALSLSSSIGHRWWTTALLLWESQIEHSNGDLDAALLAAEQGRAMAVANGDPRQTAVGSLMIGVTHMLAFRAPEAEDALKFAYRESLALGDKRSASYAAVTLGPTLWSNDLRASAAWTRDALVLAQASSEWRCIGLALTSVTYLAEFSGAHDVSARFQGAMRRDVDAFYRSQPQAERDNIDRLARRTRRTLGDAMFDRNQTLGELLPRSAAIEEAIVFTTSLAEQSELAALFTAPGPARTGADANSGGAEGTSPDASSERPGGLSQREVDVLVELASGRTNQQIAQALYVSVATVERHLVNVYRKIGVRRRTEATSFAIRHQLVRP